MNRIIGIFPDEINVNKKNQSFVKLPNPRTDTDGVYLWNSTKKRVYEIQCFSNQHRTWVVKESVISDPNLYVSNQIDELFLIIPFLIKHAHHFTTLDTLSISDEYPLFSSLCCEMFESNGKLEKLTDIKVISDDMTCYKYNKDKTLYWLSKKVDKVCEHLIKTYLLEEGSGDGYDSNDDAIQKVPSFVKDEMKATAINIVCDYLRPDMEKTLKVHLNFEDTLSEQNTLVTSPKGVKKQRKSENEENLPDHKSVKSKGVTKKKTSLPLQSGQKSILSFFSKPK